MREIKVNFIVSNTQEAQLERVTALYNQKAERPLTPDQFFDLLISSQLYSPINDLLTHTERILSR